MSVNVGLRKALDLFANLRPVSNIPNIPSRYSGLDLIIVRENTEDLYSGIEHIVVPGVVESLKIITEVASTRICRFAFEHAKKLGRKKVSAVHKANIMKLSDGLFLECFRKVARAKPKGVSVLSIAAHVPAAGGRISGARVAYGAMAPTPIRALAAEALPTDAEDEA